MKYLSAKQAVLNCANIHFQHDKAISRDNLVNAVCVDFTNENGKIVYKHPKFGTNIELCQAQISEWISQAGLGSISPKTYDTDEECDKATIPAAKSAVKRYAAHYNLSLNEAFKRMLYEM